MKRIDISLIIEGQRRAAAESIADKIGRDIYGTRKNKNKKSRP